MIELERCTKSMALIMANAERYDFIYGSYDGYMVVLFAYEKSERLFI